MSTLHDKGHAPRKRRSTQSGFTLIEMAVVVIISGFIFIPLMAVFVQKDLDDKRTENLESNQRLVNAVTFFYKQNGRYPCPADLDTAPADADFGVENCGITTTSGVKVGALPTTTLGLPFHQSINRFGWKHIYAVTSDLTDTTTFDNSTAVEVISTAGGSASTVEVPFLLVNTGEDGKGSSSLYGVENILSCTTGSARDQENCDNDETFIEAPLFFTGNPTDSGYYDDQISYGLVSAKSDIWIAQVNEIQGERVPLMAKTFGNIGIGTTTAPTEKLHVIGRALVETDFTGQGGDIATQDNAEIQGRLVVNENAIINSNFQSGQFCSGHYVPNPNPALDGICCYGEYIGDFATGQCCANGSFLNLATDAQECKSSSAFCSTSDDGKVSDLGIGYNGTSGTLDSSVTGARFPKCCYRYELDVNDLCCLESEGNHIDPDTGECV